MTTTTKRRHYARAEIKPLSKAKREKALDAYRRLTERAYIATTIAQIEPTGREDVELMHAVLAHAHREIKADKRASDRAGGTFSMISWFSGTATMPDDGPPPEMCGTTACLAGTAVAFTLEPGQTLSPYGIGEAGERVEYSLSGPVFSFEDEGAERLGLTPLQAYFLFRRYDVDFEDLKLLASLVTGHDHTRAGKRA